MLDPSILVSPNLLAAVAHHGSASPTLPGAPGAMELVREAESRNRTLAAAIEMLSSLDAAANLESAARQAAIRLGEMISAKRVLVLWRTRSRRALTVIADSDHQVDRNERPDEPLAIAAGEEVATRNTITTWPPAEATDSHALMAVAQWATQLSADSLLGVCLSDSSGRDRGVVLVIDPRDKDSGTSAANSLLAIAAPLSSKLIGIERMQPKSWELCLRSIAGAAKSSRRNLILSIAIAVMLVLLIPVRYTIRAELELQPIKHRFVAVPLDGPLESAHVRPGDLVDAGDLLATINPRELEYELASVRAELNQSLQQKKGLMAEHDFAGSKIASLESDRLRLQSELLTYRRDNLEIRSPISGVVVSGDLKQSEGMPMTRGETLFEIAPLGTMLVEIAVPEDDFGHVREGMDVDFYVRALPNRTMSGTVARLHPRAELRNHDNVYIAEVQISDPENVLRPGMRGRAKIYGDRHALVWNLFHKAWFAFRAQVGW